MSKILKRLNDNQNKVADTNGIMKLQAWDYGVVQDLTNKKITATVANASGFLFDIDLVSNGTEIDLDFKDSQLQKLTPDTYFLEIKVIDEGGDVSVFPTEGYATFTINKNLHATEGALVPQITFDTVLADVKTAMDKKVADYVKTIAKGDKGDKGDTPDITVGGRNYLLNSSGDSLSGWGNTASTWGIATDQTRGNVFTATPTTTWTGGGTNSLAQVVNRKTVGQQVTISFWAKSSVADAKFHSEQQGGAYSFDTNLTTDWAKYSYTMLDFTGKIYFMAVGAGKTYYLDDIKLEISNIDSDWVPALEDVPSNNSQLVHNTGNEVIAGDKTFTGNVTANKLNVSGDTPNTVLTYNSGFSGGSSYYFVHNKIVHMFLLNVKGFTANSQRPFEVPNSLRTSVPGTTYFVGMYGTSNALVGFNGTQVYISTSSVPYNVDTPLNAHLIWQLP